MADYVKGADGHPGGERAPPQRANVAYALIDAKVRLGGLISYGPNWREIYHRGATYVDRILKGAEPADLPVEEPIKFSLLINLKNRQDPRPSRSRRRCWRGRIR